MSAGKPALRAVYSSPPDTTSAPMPSLRAILYIALHENALEAYYKANELYNNKCEVYSISISKIKEIVNTKTEDKPFFKATIVDIYIDDAGEEKEQKSAVLVCATDVKEATKIMEDYLKQGYNMGLIGINRVKILDLI